MRPVPRPASIDIAPEVLTDLRQRLARTRWPERPPLQPWAAGTDVDYLRTLTDYWRDGFDWPAQQAAMNRLAQYRVELDGIDLFFIHQPGVGPAPLPLLLSHGWPGSIVEFQTIIPMLTDPARFGGDPADAFTVVAPALPGYPLSFVPGQPRFGCEQIADCFVRLMTEVLGYPRFVAQGGDWGSFITSRIAWAHARHVPAIHLNLLALRREPGLLADATPQEKQYRAELEHFLKEEIGYQWIQGTRPQTLAFGLNDSPAGLAAWIVEKFRAWSDCDGDLESVIGRDTVLANLTLYWATGAIGASFWPYYARMHGSWPIPGRVEVPTAYAAFPKEILRPPREVAERGYNIQRWTTMPRGGHFAALEQPQRLVDDIRAWFRQWR